MSGFRALNIESDDESDIEIDDTKELQIEDALKLYQTALKHHSEGPASFDLAAQAYDDLFKSDIFKYPESQSELRRIELYGPLSDTEGLGLLDYQDVVLGTSGGPDTAPSTLPQILHLSHKNYAQFKLDHLTARLDNFNVTLKQILDDATAALEHFVEALDKDDSDLDLWRRTANVGSILDSHRVARFCLEAVLDGDDEGLSNALSLPGLEESLAGEQLHDLVSKLDDQLSLLQAPLSLGKRSVLSKMLKQRLNTHGRLHAQERALRIEQGERTESVAVRTLLQAPKTWTEMGETLLRRFLDEQRDGAPADIGLAVSFDMNVETSMPAADESVGKKAEHPPTTQQATEKTSFDIENHPEEPPTQSEVVDQDADPSAVGKSAEEDVTMVESPTMTLPTRKRSGDEAGLADGQEEGRAKSKRTRARESIAADDGKQALLDANTRWELEQKLAELQAADDWMFETVGNLFERIGIIGFAAAKDVRQELSSAVNMTSRDTASTGLQLAKADLQAFLSNYVDSTAQILLVGGENLDFGKGTDTAGDPGAPSSRSTTMTHRKCAPMPEGGLRNLLEDVDRQWLTTEEVAWLWLDKMLRPDHELQSSSYSKHLWPDELKTAVVRVLVSFNESIFTTARVELEQLKLGDHDPKQAQGLTVMIQTIYELHLDIFCLIKKPNSGVDTDTVAAQSDRIQQWSTLAREAMHMHALRNHMTAIGDELSIRYLWATTFTIGADSDVAQAHTIECMNDLRANLVSADPPVVYLQNNAIMPELSLAALDREISRLTTKDFFLKVTSQDKQDPVAIIESLEPLLAAVSINASDRGEDAENQAQDAAQVAPELVSFLQSSDISVRILLWQRLRDAYLSIDYKPMVVSCYFKMIRVLMQETKTATTSILPQADRQLFLLKCLRLIQDTVMKTASIVQNAENAFECIDEATMTAAVSVLGEVLQLLQVFNINEDSVKLGQSRSPSLASGLAVPSAAKMTTVVHNMQVHIWILLYGLLKEAIFQFHELFPSSAEDKFDFLKVVHRNLGLRGICGSSNRAFVRMVKDEFFQLTHVEGYESEQAQVLYDLYGLNCFLNPSYELMEHNCTHDAFLDRSVALQAVDLLLSQASKLPMKDLIKHPIKETIEKVHGSASRKKPTDAIMRNRDIQRAFLRSPINPLDLYSCFKGEGNQLNVSPVPKQDAVLASKGWYFLMGHIALAKFRSQKRTAPTPTEDVDIAIAFFMQDLEFTSEKWETWFRLGQAYDTKIEEGVVWSAEKLNNSMAEIVQLQRAAIHCYTMATALAYRSAQLTSETTEKMTELFMDFGSRLYASSREPFGMLPFALDEAEKFFSGLHTGMRTGKPFEPLKMFTVWKLAKACFQRALPERSDSWAFHFMLGKCLWKMHTASEDIRTSKDIVPTAKEVLDSFTRAIELIPDKDKKDSREKKEPVLEPHYKLVSIVHKMVSRGRITLAEAKEAMSQTFYARSSSFPDEVEDWVPYVLSILKTLRTADKSNWHHRMIARAAQIVYDDSNPSNGAPDAMADIGTDPAAKLGAIGARHELTQQMFTKTMVLQVWRPECERAGRHFVYTFRYTRFFVDILEQLRDRSNLEMLARRVRRRPHDLFEHASVWSDICGAYLKLLRLHARLPEGLETATFSNIFHDEFLARKESLERWMRAQESGVSPTLDVLRDVQEFKRVNSNLMKAGSIDDLIGDAYAYLFQGAGKAAWEEEKRTKSAEESVAPIVAPLVARNPDSFLNQVRNLLNIEIPTENPENASPAPPPSSTTPLLDSTAPVKRKIGVGRREIRTCAENCFQQKSSTSTTTVPTTTTPRNLPRVQVVIDRSKEAITRDTSVEASADGSIHDEADDESELSELEEDEGSSPVEIDGKPLFPGLLGLDGSRDASEGFVSAEEKLDSERRGSEVSVQRTDVV